MILYHHTGTSTSTPDYVLITTDGFQILDPAHGAKIAEAFPTVKGSAGPLREFLVAMGQLNPNFDGPWSNVHSQLYGRLGR